MGDSPFAHSLVVVGFEAQAVRRVAGNIPFNCTFVVLHIAPYNGYITAVYAVVEELLGEFELGGLVLCHREQPAGVLVYPVDQHSHSFVLGVGVLADAQMV